MPYDSLESLISAEKGSTGHVLLWGGYTVAEEYYPIEYELKDWTCSYRAIPKNCVGWFDGESIKPVWFEEGT